MVKIMLIFFVVLYVPQILYFKKGWFKIFFHDFLGWHEPDSNTSEWSDGCSAHSKCKHCGKDIMQDSQGNWF